MNKAYNEQTMDSNPKKEQHKMNGESLTLGSLFDGIGGFPFAAVLSGVTPLWAAEIEPFCIAVAKERFPGMKHLGSVTDINGAEIPPVDIITFGSPCQDLSVAGKRKGINGERSGLFKEAIRIIQEMRKATNGKYPAYIVWENVPGAFSSNIGECPNEEIESTLSEVLEVVTPSKYYLSATACEGILRRAERRKKELPPELETALKQQAEYLTQEETEGGTSPRR